MDEVWANCTELAASVCLKPIEKKRMLKDAETRVQKEAPGEATAADGAMDAGRRLGEQNNGSLGPPEDPSRYTLLEEIGFGVTSKVFKCQRSTDMFAVKAIGLTKLRRQPGFSRIVERMHRETSILLSLKHPRIVKLVDVLEEFECLYLIMELVQGGELGEWIAKVGSFPEPTARHIFMQIVEGLSYIHSKGIIHRDLKPDNILVNQSESKEGLLEIKLTDFGHSRLINDGYSSTLTARVGTAMYWAPEVSDPAKAALGYDKAADIWSLGVILYVMLVGFFPFDNGDHFVGEKLERDITAISFERRTSGPELSPEARDLIRKLLVVDPAERLTLKQCLSHPWVASAGDGAEKSLSFMKLSSEANPNAVEVRVPFSVRPNPEELAELRRSLQQWMHTYRRFATIRQDKVIANLGDISQADEPETKRARVALQAIVERHLGRGMLVVNDAKMWSALTARTSSDESNKPATPARARGAPKASAGRTVSSNSGNSASPAVAPESADAVAAGISAPAPSAAVSAVSCGSPVSCGHSGGSAGGETFGAVQQRSARSMDVLEPPPGLPIRGAKASCDSFEKAEEPSTEPGILHRPSGSESGNYEMAVIAALQGQWVHSATAGETYEVKGFHVLRTRMQHSRPEVRPFSLRWNVGENRLEWGLAGKFFLKPPDRTPMNAAIWVPSSGGGNGFSWYRKSEGKGGSISSSSPLVQPHVQTAASSVPSRVPFVLRSQSGGGKGKATRKGSFGHS
eukprot:TRINITY_DN22163_c2_g1_i1.p1 TRINITY_DN22163_c2_g1~~TRINITY_DN22163_c2_g1_i1.p1  ORF type:complete len:874 (+),score=106.37 TRINITY_DN22163_c2_g1_i1:395-2623(+)